MAAVIRFTRTRVNPPRTDGLTRVNPPRTVSTAGTGGSMAGSLFRVRCYKIDCTFGLTFFFFFFFLFSFFLFLLIEEATPT